MRLTSNDIREHIIKMASLVELSLSFALKKDTDITEIADLEKQINEYKCAVDDLCFQYIALKSPNSRDLRLALSILKMNPVLERIGDISLQTKRFYCELSFNSPKLENMGTIVKELLKKSIDTFVHGNIEAAEELTSDDEEINILNKELIEEFSLGMKSNQLEYKDAINALWIAKNFERIGDLALCIAQEVFFIEAGEQNHYKRSNLEHSESAEVLDINKYLKSLSEGSGF